jgi:hypothetical protein
MPILAALNVIYPCFNKYNGRPNVSVNLEQPITETLGVFARGG